MRRTTVAVAVAAALAAGPTRADTVPMVAAVPVTYTPGTPFTFEIRADRVSDAGVVAGLVDFQFFDINLLFEAPSVVFQNPDPTNATLGLSASSPLPGFTPSGGMNFGTDTANLEITADQLSPTITAVPGVNDLLAVVTVTPGAGMTGPILISVDPSTLVYDPEGRIDSLPAIVYRVDQVPVTQTPTPAGIVSLGVGGLLLAARNRRRRGV